VRGKLGDIRVVGVLRVVGVDGDELVVLPPLVSHVHDTDELRLHVGERLDRLLAEHEDVDGVSVVAVTKP